jgi:hypothetical protein
MRRADRTITIIKMVFIGFCAIAAAGIWYIQLTITGPKMKCLQRPGAEWNAKTKVCRVPPSAACEQGGGWWEPQSQTCAKVINIPEFTGRK